MDFITGYKEILPEAQIMTDSVTIPSRLALTSACTESSWFSPWKHELSIKNSYAQTLNSSNFRTPLCFSCPFRQVFYHPALKLSKNNRLRGVVVDLCDPKWRCMLLSFLICFSAGQRHYVLQNFKQKVKYQWVVIWVRKCEIKERGSKKTGFGKRIGLKKINSCSKAEISKWNILVEK